MIEGTLLDRGQRFTVREGVFFPTRYVLDVAQRAKFGRFVFDEDDSMRLNGLFTLGIGRGRMMLPPAHGIVFL